MRILFAGRPIACAMGVLTVFYSENSICWQAHCMCNGVLKAFIVRNLLHVIWVLYGDNGCFIVIILFASRPTACATGVFEVFYSENFICWQAHCV